MKHLGILAPFAAVVLTVILSGMNSESFVSFDSAAVAEAQPEEPVAESIEIVRNPIENASRSGRRTILRRNRKRTKKSQRAIHPSERPSCSNRGRRDTFSSHRSPECNRPHLPLEGAHLLVDEFSGNLVERAANSQLQIVADKGQSYLVDIEDDHGETVRILVPKSKVSVRYDSWFYSDNLKGWVFSGLCTVID